jgi:GDPmannose 4,6-dehydratase
VNCFVFTKGLLRFTQLDTLPTARDYVEGMWRMLQQDNPEDFVLATGEMHYVREFVEKAFKVVGVVIK